MGNSSGKRWIAVAGFIGLFLFASGCAGPKPILYPNEHLKQVGADQAERDIDDCKRLAEEYVSSNEAATVATNTAVGGAAGGAVGAVGGAIRGAAGSGAAIGAATGATIGLIRGLFQASQPTPTEKAFVDRCLHERGYESIGWE